MRPGASRCSPFQLVEVNVPGAYHVAYYNILKICFDGFESLDINSLQQLPLSFNLSYRNQLS